MAIYVCWEDDMLFCVKRCQNITKRGSCCTRCSQLKVKLTMSNDVKFFAHGCHICKEILEFFK